MIQAKNKTRNILKQCRFQAILLTVTLLFDLLFCLGCQEQPVPEFTEAPQTALTALFFSDTQADPATGDYSALGELLARATAQKPQPALIIFGGDTVNDGGDSKEWQKFWQAAATPLAGLITAAVPGNHDNYALLAEQFNYPAQAPLAPGAGFFYSFDMGGVHFIMLDSNIMGAARPEDIEWLKADLQSAAALEADWRVAVIHHPMWPLTDNPKDLERAAVMREHFLPLLQSYGVDLLLCGHQHLYGRSLPQRGDGAALDGGLIQIMAASGAKESYSIVDGAQVALSADAPNYLLLTADSAALTITAYNGINEAFDTYALKRDNKETSWRIRVVGPTGAEVWSFTEAELEAAWQNSIHRLSSIQPGQFSHVYSAINNWPTARFYVAEGYSVAAILLEAGLYKSARTVTFRAADGYEVSLTAEQLFSPQYFFPRVGENDSDAAQVFPIIAFRWREGADDLDNLREDKPSLIIGQRYPLEHNNPAFVVGVTEIIVSDAPTEAWPPASTFPLPGPIAAGETVKLQHPDYGLVKLHYTLDGSEPTPLSPMYNPSAYQPELNKPIPITEPTVIKVLVSGYGKADSEIAVFEFTTVK